MKINIASNKAVKYACMKFHYAKTLPVPKYSFNIFNNKNEWCGVIMYGPGANFHIGTPFGLYQGEILELTRVALNGKQEKTSQAVAMSLRKIHKMVPHIKMIVSYADLDQNHVGTIYQATNWIYLGKFNENAKSTYIIHGKKHHNRIVHMKGLKSNLETVKKYIDPRATRLITKGKHKYIFVFDKILREKLLKKSKPYPKK